jgi:hypothetical protein
MTDLVFVGGTDPRASVAVDRWPAGRPLHFLATFAAKPVMEIVQGWPAASRMLDSGAFTAYHQGSAIDLEALIAEGVSGRWDEVVALDVIGDPDGSIANAERMRAAGCVATPVFHIGDPWEHLEHYVEHWPKVGLSCRFGEPKRESLRFYEQCFARGWPAKFHSFGWVHRDVLIRFPFASADAATWIVAPASFRRCSLRKRGVETQVDARVGTEMVAHLMRQHLEAGWALQQELRAFWGPTLKELE